MTAGLLSALTVADATSNASRLTTESRTMTRTENPTPTAIPTVLGTQMTRLAAAAAWSALAGRDFPVKYTAIAMPKSRVVGTHNAQNSPRQGIRCPLVDAALPHSRRMKASHAIPQSAL